MSQKQIQESDLYQPIYDFLAAQGYLVRGEVRDCDVVALKGDELIIVELKRNLNLELIIQGTLRQQTGDSVYIAVPRPSKRVSRSRWNGIYHLIRRLELGLIFVSFTTKKPRVEVVIHPVAFDRNRSRQSSKKKRISIVEEANSRTGDYNVGGSVSTKLMTAYRENCIQIGVYLKHFGQLSPKQLRGYGTGEKTASILQKNYYGWFERVRRGVYQLTSTGEQELKNYPELVEVYFAQLSDSIHQGDEKQLL